MARGPGHEDEDAWTMRCILNHRVGVNIAARMKSGEILEELDIPTPDADPKYGLGEGGKSVWICWIDRKAGVTVAKLHGLMRPDGSYMGDLDPKRLHYRGSVFHLHGGSGPEAHRRRNPECNLPDGPARWRYIARRRRACELFMECDDRLEASQREG